MKRYCIIKVDPLFQKELDDIKIRRIEIGKDKITSPKSYRRITKGIRRLKDWEIIKDRIVNADMEDDKIN